MNADKSNEDWVALCPSAVPQMRGSVAFGVVAGAADAPRLRHFEHPLPVTDDLLKLSEPVSPTEVFRFAAPCACNNCSNFRESRCSLASRIVTWLPIVVEKLPTCSIRPNCRWWRDEGQAACFRCPQVVTDNYRPTKQMQATCVDDSGGDSLRRHLRDSPFPA
jgi:hypothetical protein